MKNLILFGPPGSGKGTQASKLVEKYDLKHISTGDIFREELKNNSALGQKAREFMDQGLLVPDEVVIAMLGGKMDQYLAANPKGFIFDGFPRTVAQAEALERLMIDKSMSIDKVLSLVVSEEELTKRILLRGQSSGRADDANRETVKRRVDEYKVKTAPVAYYYQQRGILSEIKGEGSIEDIFANLCAAIEG